MFDWLRLLKYKIQDIHYEAAKPKWLNQQHLDCDKAKKEIDAIKHDSIKLWAYIDSQKEGSFGRIMTHEYRVKRAHEEEENRHQAWRLKCIEMNANKENERAY